MGGRGCWEHRQVSQLDPCPDPAQCGEGLGTLGEPLAAQPPRHRASQHHPGFQKRHLMRTVNEMILYQFFLPKQRESLKTSKIFSRRLLGGKAVITDLRERASIIRLSTCFKHRGAKVHVRPRIPHTCALVSYLHPALGV